MNDEAKELLREIRDIGLRNEQRLIRDIKIRRVALAFVGLVVITLLGLLFWLMTKMAPLLDEEVKHDVESVQGKVI